jgi:hypothetical protein
MRRSSLGCGWDWFRRRWKTSGSSTSMSPICACIASGRVNRRTGSCWSNYRMGPKSQKRSGRRKSPTRHPRRRDPITRRNYSTFCCPTSSWGSVQAVPHAVRISGIGPRRVSASPLRHRIPAIADSSRRSLDERIVHPSCEKGPGRCPDSVISTRKAAPDAESKKNRSERRAKESQE